MSVLLTDEADRVVDTSSEYNQTARHDHGASCFRCAVDGLGHEGDCDDLSAVHCSLSTVHSQELRFVPPSQGARIAELTRRVAQQEGDLNQACRRIAEQGQTIRMARRDLLDLLSKAKAGVEITFYDIANIIPDEPAANVPEFLKAA